MVEQSREAMVTYIGIREYISTLSLIVLEKFRRESEEYIELVVVINSCEVGVCVVMVLAFASYLYSSLKRQEYASWAIVQIFSSEMLANNQYFKTLMNRQKSQL